MPRLLPSAAAVAEAARLRRTSDPAPVASSRPTSAPAVVAVAAPPVLAEELLLVRWLLQKEVSAGGIPGQSAYFSVSGGGGAAPGAQSAYFAPK